MAGSVKLHGFAGWSREATLKTPKGTRDLLAEETALFQEIERRALSHFAKYGFREIRTPIFEETALFLRGIGEATDIVTKEMYTFEDKSGRSMTLRPELTAAVCRAVIQHNLASKDRVARLMYMGPMFRYERPQAGRYRQFHQLGVEVFGSDHPLIDVETIDALMTYLKPFELPNLTLTLNSVGDQTDRPKYLEYLRRALHARKERLCSDCQIRLEKNVLRVLDCKNPNCQGEFGELAPIAEFWSRENREHFEQVCRGLSGLGVPYELNYRLVRGLDYYTKTAFELLSGDLGAQSAVMGGGRYDNLLNLLGGKDCPAFGWALGIDRLAEILKRHHHAKLRTPDVFFVFGDSSWLFQYFPLIKDLRSQGLCVGYDSRVGSFKSQMKRANKEGTRYVAIIGENENVAGKLTLKNMSNAEQILVPQNDLVTKIKEANHA